MGIRPEFQVRYLLDQLAVFIGQELKNLLGCPAEIDCGH